MLRLSGGKDFGEVHGAARGVLRDLLAATEAIGDEESVGRGAADGGQQDAFTEDLRDLEFFALEAERPGHAAAAGVEQFDLSAGAAQEVDFISHLHHGFVMAVAVEDDFRAGELRGLVVGRVADEEFAEEEGLVAQALGAWVRWEEVHQLVAEDTGAAGLEEDEGQAGVDLRGELVEDALEIGASLLQESKIVEWAATADVPARDFGGKSGLRENLGGGVEGLRVVVVVPGVGPQQDWPSRRTRFAPFTRMLLPI